MKAAVLSYPTSNNLGDSIQSIAAAELLSEKPLAINRDALDSYKGEAVKLLMNGWFMESPQNWPPSKSIAPLFLSFHLNPTAAAGMLSPLGVSYFKTHQPIGCRDRYTQKILEEKGIKTFFTGCLTLSLKRERFVAPKTKRSGILVLSVHERMLPEFNGLKNPSLKTVFEDFIQVCKYPGKRKAYFKVKNHLDRFLKKQTIPIHYSSQIVAVKNYNEAERGLLAIQQLEKIAKAAYVITSRIHTALPAVAMETPVLFLSDGLDHLNQNSRLKGLDDFFPVIKTEELKTIELASLKATTEHLPYVKEMKKAITTFFSALEKSTD